MKLAVKELHNVYIDNLEEWIEIPVYETEGIAKITTQVDWDGLSLVEYKKLLIDHIDLEPRIRAKISSYIVRDEVYEFIIRKNPGLKPKNASVSGLPFYTEQEAGSVMEWFASHAIRGKKPEVVMENASAG